MPKGTLIDYTIYATHREELFQGEDVEAFKPERWRGRKSGFQFLPFNAGGSLTFVRGLWMLASWLVFQ